MAEPMSSSPPASGEDATTTYEELARIEMDFEDIDTRIISTQYNLSLPVYDSRAGLVAKISNFWALVFEQAPPDVDQYIQPSDSAVFASCLKSLTVTRFEVPSSIPSDSSNISDYGEPRSLGFKFEFAENEWFEDTTLEKRFWYRRAKDGWAGRISEPVRINWKKGKDLSDGLCDAACDLSEAVKRQRTTAPESGRDSLPEFQKLRKRVEGSTEGSQSFFTWFAYRGRDISEEESAEATRVEMEKREKARKGEKIPDELEQIQDDDNQTKILEEEAIEVFPAGDELAVAIAEDLWPGAIRYFTYAQEDNDDLSDADFEEDVASNDDDEGDVPDIRSLVKDSQRSSAAGNGGPPTKKRKT